MGAGAFLWAMRPDGSGNVTDSHLEWTYRGAVPRRASLLLVDDLLFMVHDGGVAACVDATTGEVVWFDAPPAREGQGRGFATRGVAYWADGQDARILAVIGSRLVALNAKTGARYSDFGAGGEVDLTQGYDDRQVASFRWRSAPVIINDVIVIGSAIGDITSASMPALKESKGHLLLTGSAAGRATIPGSMYSATKWAVSAIGYGVEDLVSFDDGDDPKEFKPVQIPGIP